MPRRKPPRKSKSLRAIRRRRGLTITELGRRAKVPKSTIHRFETEGIPASASHLLRLCQVLRVSFASLLRNGRKR